MHVSLSALLGLAALTAQVQGHGQVTKPKARLPGDATAGVCGTTLVKFYQADETSYPEALMRANPKGLDSAYDAKKCNLYFCKGFQFADNKANVYSYKPGEKVDFTVQIRIPHEGYANVSIVDTAANKAIGSPLFAWPSGYASGKDFPSKIPANQTAFSVTIPDLGSKCATAGACVRETASCVKNQATDNLL